MYLLWLNIKCYHLKRVAHKTWKKSVLIVKISYSKKNSYLALLYTFHRRSRKSSHACSSHPFSLRSISVFKVCRLYLFTKGQKNPWAGWRLLEAMLSFSYPPLALLCPTTKVWHPHNKTDSNTDLNSHFKSVLECYWPYCCKYILRTLSFIPALLFTLDNISAFQRDGLGLCKCIV